jgi:hypothetical protein
MDDRQKTLKRIQALFARGDSPFDEEARTSLHTAHKLMKQHGITLAEVAQLDQKPRDPTADEIVAAASGLIRDHMSAIGQMGGLVGGAARAAKLSKKRRTEIAKAAGIASGEARRQRRGY